MQIQDLKQKMVAVAGYGVEGKAVTAYLIKYGLKPILFDQKPWKDWSQDEQQAIKKLEVNFAFGPDAFMELKGFDFIFRSPGIKLDDLTLHISSKTIITSQTKWFFDNCPAKIIGVTGTKGKGTTASLIYEMLEANFAFEVPKTVIPLHKNYLTGNIGKIQPFEILDGLTNYDTVVYELSSFQLQDLTKSPKIGVILMVTAEHLDYHKDLGEYHEAKAPIVKFQNPNDIAIINTDFPASIKIGEQTVGTKIYFSRLKQPNSNCFVSKNKIIFLTSTGVTEEIFDVNELQLKGDHNWENVCASICAAQAAGVKLGAIQAVLKKFKGLEHRLEFVAEKGGIKFYNDSFSTTPETAIAAINSFNEPEILILGGSEKKSDFTELGQEILSKRNIKALILIGKESARIKAAISSAGHLSGKIFEGATNIKEVFAQIHRVASSGDIVLLSPACASFDMFKNYKDRGEQFKLEAQHYIN